MIKAIARNSDQIIGVISIAALCISILIAEGVI